MSGMLFWDTVYYAYQYSQQIHRSRPGSCFFNNLWHLSVLFAWAHWSVSISLATQTAVR